MQLHPVSSLGLAASRTTSLQGGPDEQPPQELPSRPARRGPSQGPLCTVRLCSMFRCSLAFAHSLVLNPQRRRRQAQWPANAKRPSPDAVQRLFELSLDMLGTASADGYFTELNPAWERWLGWTREELMAEPFISFVHPDDVDGDARADREPRGPRRPDGRRLREPLPHPRRRLPAPPLDDGLPGRRPVLRGEGHDRPPAGEIEREQAELRIRDSEALHRTLTANLPDTTVFLLDHELRVLVADGEAIRRLGSSARTCSADARWPSCTPRCPTTSSSSASRTTAPR